jgi:hypothetical protein
MIFYAFYKILQKGYTIEDVSLRLGPSKDSGPRNWVPRPTGRRARRKSGGSGGAPGRGTTWGRVHAHLGPIGSRGWGRGSTLRRRTAVTGGDGRDDSGFRRGGCTGWTTRDARGSRKVYGQRPMIWWLGTAWTKARRRRRSWRRRGEDGRLVLARTWAGSHLK